MKPRLEMASKGARISDGTVVTAGQVVYGASDGRAWVVIGVDPWRESHQVLARSDDDRHQYREPNPAWLVSEPPRPTVPDLVTIPPVRPFAGVATDKAHALKPLEEAAEIYGAWQACANDCESPVCRECHNASRGLCGTYTSLVDECCDTILATCNLLSALGVTDLTDAMAACEKRNEERGRYGDR